MRVLNVFGTTFFSTYWPFLWRARATWVLPICVQQTLSVRHRIPNNPRCPSTPSSNVLSIKKPISCIHHCKYLWFHKRRSRNATRIVLHTAQECYQSIGIWGKLLKHKWWEIAVNHSFTVFWIGTSCFVANTAANTIQGTLSSSKWQKKRGQFFLKRLFGMKQQGNTIFRYLNNADHNRTWSTNNI